ncbi:cupin domain-containing protein [Rubellimicrobium aerolatum]|uniref:Cupin domain-containing protein n=1 Tax=Rubellimicrobium aerolatum TaxID=490979 RepID=A0ABW0S8Z5_9RHOB|nr:cupin domain-containing protein [Rubellimicrobium aerolatum]MBP1804776.1 quercetin dioxygenase-like cupin family protein [Rubellimicrobium aerolatum]
MNAFSRRRPMAADPGRTDLGARMARDLLGRCAMPVSAPAPDGAAPLHDWNGTTYRAILPAAATGGALSIVDSTSPARSGPPRHVHAREDECFVILTGEVEFWVAGRTFRKGPGEAAFIPRGTEHTFRALTASRHLLILTPGGFEGFFAEMAQRACRLPEDMAAVIESAGRHGATFTGSPL